jgi:hypothetical protein
MCAVARGLVGPMVATASLQRTTGALNYVAYPKSKAAVYRPGTGKLAWGGANGAARCIAWQASTALRAARWRAALVPGASALTQVQPGLQAQARAVGEALAGVTAGAARPGPMCPSTPLRYAPTRHNETALPGPPRYSRPTILLPVCNRAEHLQGVRTCTARCPRMV